jgi:hypothetical protein
MARLVPALLAATLATGLVAPAAAHDPADQISQTTTQTTWQGQYPVAAMPYGAPVYGAPVYSPPVYSAPVYNGAAAPEGYLPAPQSAAVSDPRYREMIDKCQGVTHRNSGTTGAVIGGLVGGVAGNRIASANRILGTVAGAAVGAVAGGAIGTSIDKNRERECEQFFSSYAPQQAPGYGYGVPAGGYAYGYPAYGYVPMTGAPMGYVMVPAGAPQVAAPAQGACTETRTVTYEYVPVTRRYISAPPRRRVVHDKRVWVPSGS